MSTLIMLRQLTDCSCEYNQFSLFCWTVEFFLNSCRSVVMVVKKCGFSGRGKDLLMFVYWDE